MDTQTPRLAPIEKPDSWIMKAAYVASKKMFGKVITPMKVTYSRMPDAMHFSRKLQEVEGKLTIGNEFSLLVKTLTATINDCKFCVDIARYYALKKGFDIKKFNEILNYLSSTLFSEKEKAGLAYAEGVTTTGHVDDKTFENVMKYFSEKEIVEIGWMVAAETYYNKMNHALNIGNDDLENFVKI
jgi:AhpD family alkylhydroperoxidase